MMNYSTLNSMVKPILLLAISQFLFIQITSAQCPPSVSVTCIPGGQLVVTAELDSPPGSNTCPASITAVDDTGNATTLTRVGSCAAGDDTYLGPVGSFDCNSATIDILGGCVYPITGGGLLPIELGNFAAIIDKGKVTLTWVTYSELDNDYFTIERSSDGIHFKAIGEESGAGTTFEEQQYSFTDERPINGVNYYRLSQTDFDGASESFNVLSVSLKSSGNDALELFPNPTKDFVNLTFSGVISGKQATLNLFDLNGKLLKSQELSLESSYARLGLEDIPQGMYIVTAQVGRQLFHKKLSVH